MFKAWQTVDYRATIDIDLLGKTNNTVQNLENICREICQQESNVNDGIFFPSNTVQGRVIQTEAEYEGVRIEQQLEAQSRPFRDELAELSIQAAEAQPSSLLSGESPSFRREFFNLKGI